MTTKQKRLSLLTAIFFAGVSSVYALSPTDLGSTPSVVSGVQKTLRDTLGIDESTVATALGRFIQYPATQYCQIKLRDYDVNNPDRARAFLALNASVLVSNSLSPQEKANFLSCAYGNQRTWTDIVNYYGKNPTSEVDKIKTLFLNYVSHNPMPANDDVGTYIPASKTGSVNSLTPGLYQGVLKSFSSLFALPPQETGQAMKKFADFSGEKYCGVDTSAFQSVDSVRNFVNLFASVLIADLPKEDQRYFFTCAFDNPNDIQGIFQFSKTYGHRKGRVLQDSLYQNVQALGAQKTSKHSPTASYSTNEDFAPSTSASTSPSSASASPNNRMNSSSNPYASANNSSDSFSSPSVPVRIQNHVNLPPNQNPTLILPIPSGNNPTVNNNNNNNNLYYPVQSAPVARELLPPTIVIAQNGGSAHQPVANDNSVETNQQQQQQQQAPPMVIPYPMPNTQPAPSQPAPYYPPPYPYPPSYPYPYPPYPYGQPPAQEKPAPAPAPAQPQITPQQPQMRPTRPPRRRPPQNGNRRPPRRPPTQRP